MRLSEDKNDRVMVGTMTMLVGLEPAVGLNNIAISVPSKGTATASPAPRTATYKTPPARGVVPHAHSVGKIVKSDSPVSIVRDPTEL
jgi:hypothetical protein